MTLHTLSKSFMAAALSLLVLVSGCSMFNDSPSKVAENFLNAIDQQRFDDAQKFATPETVKMLDVLAGFAKMTKKKEKSEMHRFEILNEEIVEDTATVIYKVKDEDGEQSLKLVKVEGKWLVSLSKADLPPKDDSALEDMDDNDSLHNDMYHDEEDGHVHDDEQ